MSENKKIKICHFAHRLTGKSDGIFTHLKMLFELLEKERFEQILMYSGNEENINSYCKSLGIKVYNIPELYKKVPIKLFFKMMVIFKEENIDIIHTHLVKPYIFAGLVNLFLNKKLIFNYQGVFLSKNYYSNIERIILRLLHIALQLKDGGRNILAITPSKISSEELKKNGKFRRILHYYNGFINKTDKSSNDIKVVNYFNQLKKSYFLVGIVARHEKQKRLDIALKILQKCLKQTLNVFFVFIGDGPQFAETQDIANGIGVKERCYFIEYLSNLPNYLHFFDLILFTSEWEGFPLTIWEAMYNEVPIVSSDVGGIKEIFESENCGIVYPFADVNECVNIISDLYFNREKLKELGKNGKRAIIEKYNEKNFRDFFVQLYTEIINEK